jgi:hypothetical protein
MWQRLGGNGMEGDRMYEGEEGPKTYRESISPLDTLQGWDGEATRAVARWWRLGMATILKLLACEDQMLLVRRNTLLVLNLSLHVIDGVR